MIQVILLQAGTDNTIKSPMTADDELVLILQNGASSVSACHLLVCGGLGSRPLASEPQTCQKYIRRDLFTT